MTAANVYCDVEVGGGKAFLVDDEPASLLVKQATLNGNSITPSNLEWRSNVQGTLTDDATVGTTLEVSLEAATHTLTLIADCGEYGTVREDIELRVLPRLLEIPPSRQRQPLASAP